MTRSYRRNAITNKSTCLNLHLLCNVGNDVTKLSFPFQSFFLHLACGFFLSFLFFKSCLALAYVIANLRHRLLWDCRKNWLCRTCERRPTTTNDAWIISQLCELCNIVKKTSEALAGDFNDAKLTCTTKNSQVGEISQNLISLNFYALPRATRNNWSPYAVEELWY